MVEEEAIVINRRKLTGCASFGDDRLNVSIDHDKAGQVANLPSDATTTLAHPPLAGPDCSLTNYAIMVRQKDPLRFGDGLSRVSSSLGRAVGERPANLLRCGLTCAPIIPAGNLDWLNQP